MGLKAVLLDFSGVIFDDTAINQALVADILLQENLRPDDGEYTNYFRGRSDRTGLKNILANRGRVLSDEYLDRLLASKNKAYREQVNRLNELSISKHLAKFFTNLQEQNIAVGLVTGTPKSEVEYVLQKAELDKYIDTIVAGDDLLESKPEPEPYLLALKNLNLAPSECLAIEDNPVGIESAKQANIQVVGIAKIYPLHMLQRKANWTVDNFSEIELDRVDHILSRV